MQTKITRPTATLTPTKNGSKPTSAMQTSWYRFYALHDKIGRDDILHARNAGIPPLTYLTQQNLADDRLPFWRDALLGMTRADLATVTYWVHEYLGRWAFRPDEDRRGITLHTINTVNNRQCRELEILEGFETLWINDQWKRNEIGLLVKSKLRDDPTWHPSGDQILDVITAAKKKFTAVRRRLTRLCNEADERASGQS